MKDINKINKEEAFWKKRSEKYNNLDWVKEPTYLEAFINSANFNKKDIVLDVGTGTGVISHSVAPLVDTVIGIDISQDMLEHSNWKENKYFIKRDIRNPIFCDEVFDKVTARMVFHHIIEDTQKAMDICYKVLKKGGKIILSEGIPPSPDVKNEYVEIFKLKEERLTFLEKDLTDLMKKSGFSKIKVITHTMRNFSVKNWLENSSLPKETQDKIFKMHLNGSKKFKEDYNLKIIKDDCLIDCKNLIVIGVK